MKGEGRGEKEKGSKEEIMEGNYASIALVVQGDSMYHYDYNL